MAVRPHPTPCLPPPVQRRLRLVLIGGAALLALHNFFPYLGLRYEGCQTMFSDLVATAGRNNHLFLPQHDLSDLGSYRAVLGATVTPAPSGPRARQLAAWLTGASGRLYNVEAIRGAVSGLCDAASRVQLTYREPDGRVVDLPDACTSWPGDGPRPWIPFRLYAPRARAGVELAHEQGGRDVGR